MTDVDNNDPELLRHKINSETAQIPWKELQRYFASGKTRVIHPQLDLVEVAFQLSRDNARQIEDWVERGMIQAVSNDQARQWFEADEHLWACVVAPWVLIQAGRPTQPADTQH
ncbi:MAG: DUF2288 domain-containing protein [Gammaproteobacteria bacterium]|nr:DUF2288 domain-containing protein [Gammaproteobacteria bacterium]